MAVAEAVFGFEEVDLLHVLFLRDGVEEVEPVGNGFAVLLFDGWEVGGGAGGFLLRLHLLVVPLVGRETPFGWAQFGGRFPGRDVRRGSETFLRKGLASGTRACMSESS